MFKCLYLDVESVCLHYYENSASDNYAHNSTICLLRAHTSRNRTNYMNDYLAKRPPIAHAVDRDCQVIQLFEMRRKTFELRVNTFGEEDKIK